jgi:glycosyltransferase involved in cell wall biosynthesis
VSAFVARSTELLLGLPAGAVRVIYNGVPPAPALASRSPSSTPVIGAVGRLSHEKGLDTLLRAVQAIPDCQLTILGDGDERANLESLASSLGIAGRVTFAGWVEPPWTARWSFDVLAMPSHYEGFPLVLLEAMQAGIPVVASAVGGIPEMIVDGHDGVLVPPQDSDALARALTAVLADRAGREAMTGRARVVAERFTTERMAEQFEALYAELPSRAR